MNKSMLIFVSIALLCYNCSRSQTDNAQSSESIVKIYQFLNIVNSDTINDIQKKKYLDSIVYIANSEIAKYTSDDRYYYLKMNALISLKNYQELDSFLGSDSFPNGQNPVILFYRALCNKSLGNEQKTKHFYSQAISELNKSMEQYPDSLELWIISVYFTSQIESYGSARMRLDSLIEIYPQSSLFEAYRYNLDNFIQQEDIYFGP